MRRAEATWHIGTERLFWGRSTEGPGGAQRNGSHGPRIGKCLRVFTKLHSKETNHPIQTKVQQPKVALPGFTENNTLWAIAKEFSRAEATSGHHQRNGTRYREGLSLHLSWEDSGQVLGRPGPPQTFHTPPKIAGQATLTSATRQGKSPALLRAPGEHRLSHRRWHRPPTSHLLSGFVTLRE